MNAQSYTKLKLRRTMYKNAFSTQMTYKCFFGKITASDHSFVVHDVRVTQLFAHTRKRKKKHLPVIMT